MTRDAEEAPANVLVSQNDSVISIVGHDHNDLEGKKHSPAFQYVFLCRYVTEKNLISYCFQR